MLERLHVGGTACRLLAASLLAILAGSASAGIVNAGSKIEVRGIPTGAEMGGVRVDPGDLELDNRLQVWLESTTTLGSALTVGHSGAGLVDDDDDLNPGQIAAGTTVQSYYLLFNHVDDSRAKRLRDRDYVPGQFSRLSIEFTHPIVGVFLNTHDPHEIADTDLLFQPQGVTYNAHGGWRGLELGTSNSGDRFIISDDRRTLTVINLKTPGHEIDAFRVLIAPEPGTAPLLLLGIGIAFGAMRRRRKRKQLAAAQAAGTDDG